VHLPRWGLLGSVVQASGAGGIKPEQNSGAGTAEPRYDWGVAANAKRRKPVLVQIVATIAVLGIAVGGAYYLVTSKPSTKRKPRARQAAMVEVREVEMARKPIIIEASGTVVASRVVELRPELSGQVTAIGKGLEPGALLRKGALVAQIDSRDYAIALRRAKSGRARANADLDIEHGRQRIAKEELDVFKRENAVGPQVEKSADQSDLALRKPQLDGAVAGVSDAKAQVAQAQLDLSRTRLSSPFDALVRERSVSPGSLVSPTTMLAMLVGVDTWWIEVTVPKGLMRWLALPKGSAGAKVRIYDQAAWGDGVSREGEVLRIGSEVVAGGRLVRVLVGVDDPLALSAPEGTPRLLLSSWVRLEIVGRDVEGIPLARDVVHDGDRVFVMKDDALDIRKVSVVARLRDEVIVSAGLAKGDRVVTSDLPYPVQGMKLQLVPSKPEATRR
jgi:RND family efflux transporter MFP subunit